MSAHQYAQHIMILFAVVTPTMVFGQSDLQTTIGGMSPEFYWPLEDSFGSESPSGSSRVAFDGYEYNTPDWMKWGSSGNWLASEYFPLLFDHMTTVPSSSALVFGETTGDLAVDGNGHLVPGERYLTLTSSNFGSDEPQDALGLSKKDEWTMHFLVSPDADSSDDRGYETIFQVGASGNGTTLEVDRQASQAIFRLTRETNSGAYSYQSTVTVGDSFDYEASGRSWYQVIIRYRDNSPYQQILRVNQIDDTDNSNGWITENTSGDAMLGANQSGGGVFKGAIQHFAIWNSDIGSTAVSSLESARTVAPTPRADLNIAWNADPVYYVWTVPTSTAPLTSGTRDLRTWRDGLWSRTGVWPMVRFYSDQPTQGYATPPGYGAQSGNTPECMAAQATNWVEYINDSLDTYCGKDLSAGYLLLLQNWGKENWNEHNNSGSPYEDRTAARGLMRNWRDASYLWRSGTYSLDAQYHQIAEVDSPFYREGVSVNAFRTREMFGCFADDLAAVSLVVPTRLHFDTEAMTTVRNALPSSDSSLADAFDNSNGWWHAAADPSFDCRADSDAYWMGGGDTLADLCSPGSDTSGPYASANDLWGIEFTDFSRGQYDHAFGPALMTPAIEELGSGVRGSEYDIYNAAISGTNHEMWAFPQKVSRPMKDVSVETLDFASPVLYPVKQSMLEGTESSCLEVWGDELSLSTLLGIAFPRYDEASPSLTDLTSDLNDIFVERAKHNVVASYRAGGASAGKPMAPWLFIPGQTVDISERFDTDDDSHLDSPLEYASRWEDVARIAVFAYRYGVREFIFWGSDDTASTTANVLGLKSVLDTLDYAVASRFDVTTSGTSRGDAEYGLPDGTEDSDDYDYLTGRYTVGDREADVTDSSYSGHPDGVVDLYDYVAIENHFN